MLESAKTVGGAEQKRPKHLNVKDSMDRLGEVVAQLSELTHVLQEGPIPTCTTDNAKPVSPQLSLVDFLTNAPEQLDNFRAECLERIATIKNLLF